MTAASQPSQRGSTLVRTMTTAAAAVSTLSGSIVAMNAVLFMTSRAWWVAVPSANLSAAFPGAMLPSLMAMLTRPAPKAVAASQPPGPSASRRTLHR